MHMKVLTIFAVTIGVAYAQTTAAPSGGGSGGGSSCSGDVSSEASKATSFTQPQTAKIKNCKGLNKGLCITVDEAGQQCPCTCDALKGQSDSGKGGKGGNNGGNNGNNGDNGNSGKGGGKGGSKPGCFAANAMVRTEQYGEITMRQLAETHRDARVLSRSDDGKFDYAPVNYWIHAKSDVDAKFVRLQTESGRAVSMTGEHLVYVTDCNGGESSAKFARNVELGKCLYYADGGKFVESRVVAKSVESSTGIYAPITTNGNIVVDDVLASCFTMFENESAQKFIYGIIANVQNALAAVLPSFDQQNADAVEPSSFLYHFLHLSKYFVH